MYMPTKMSAPENIITALGQPDGSLNRNALILEDIMKIFSQRLNKYGELNRTMLVHSIEQHAKYLY